MHQRLVAARRLIQLAPHSVAAAAGARGARWHAGPEARAPCAPRGSARQTARSGEPSAPAQAPAGGNDHHAPKTSCRDPGDPPETARQRRARLMTAVTTVTTPGETGRRCVPASASRARRSIGGSGPPARHVRGRRGRPRRGPWHPVNDRRSSTCCTTIASWISRPPRSMPRCSSNRPTAARRARCIASWRRSARCASGAIRRGIRRTPSRSSWPRRPIRSGRGTSRS